MLYPAPPSPRANNATFGPTSTGPAAAGAFLMVHDPREAPSTADAVTVPPGMAADVKVTATLLHRLPPPHGECPASWYRARFDAADDPWPGDGDPVGYSRERCEWRCYVRAVAQRCACYMLPWPEDDEAVAFASMVLGPIPNDTLPLCGEDEEACMRGTKVAFSARQLGCEDHCPIKCHEWHFSAAASYQAFPARNSYPILLAGVQGLKGNGSVDLDYLSRNIIQVRIFVPRFEVLAVTTEAAYGLTALLGDVGGTSGLYIGISLVSVIEVIELLSLILFAAGACTYCYPPNDDRRAAAASYSHLPVTQGRRGRVLEQKQSFFDDDTSAQGVIRVEEA